jgi:hypothetical protein
VEIWLARHGATEWSGPAGEGEQGHHDRQTCHSANHTFPSSEFASGLSQPAPYPLLEAAFLYWRTERGTKIVRMMPIQMSE